MKIKNWSQFQHFKDRRPPWIKLYRDILDDLEWHELDPKCAKVLVMLWLIASESDGVLPDIKRLSFRLRMTEKDIEASLSKLSHWMEQDDIEAISSRYQDDLPEREEEIETEIEKEAEKETRKRVVALQKPEDVGDQVWSDWIALRKGKRAVVTETVVTQARSEAAKAGLSLEDFFKIWCLRGSQGLQADWIKPAEKAQFGFKNQGDRNAEVLQGLTRGLVGGGSNVKLLGN